MAAPNLLSLTTVTAQTAVQIITTSTTAIVTNGSGSGKAMKINSLYISNVSSASASVTIDIYRSGTAYKIASTISVPINSTLDMIDKIIYLQEGDTLRLTASANGYLQAVCSYEEIS